MHKYGRHCFVPIGTQVGIRYRSEHLTTMWGPVAFAVRGFWIPLRRLFAFHLVALPAGAVLLLRDALRMVTACMSATTGTVKTAIHAMRRTTTFTPIQFAEYGTGSATVATESAV